jgi:predicted enzyme related to lactoylglutathione lyase
MAGKMVHAEIPASDTSRAREFWGSLFGWQWQSFEGPQEYYMTQLSDDSGAAVYPAEGNPPGIRVYFNVDDVNAGAGRVRELGGQCEDPQPVPGMGWFALCTDPEGNNFGLWQSDPSAQPPSG